MTFDIFCDTNKEHILENTLVAKAAAKINLHLQVLNKRADNFHNLLTVMCELKLFDLLKLKSFEAASGQKDIFVEISGEYSSLLDGLSSDDNLIVKGVKNLLLGYNSFCSIEFSLTKNIPSGAGLGGGSSDAASAIALAANALGIKDSRAIYDAACLTGSDVPFFLKGGLCIARGRGEILEEVSVDYKFPVVLVNNGIHISTALAYRELKRGLEPFPEEEIEERSKRLKEVLGNPELWKDVFLNDFEGPVFSLYPELKKLKEKFYENGAFFALMSGSGSTVYGLFYSKDEACYCMEKLKKEGNRCFFTELATSRMV